ELVLIDSGLACDAFNLICRARLEPSRLSARIREAAATFETAGRPFSWWVGPMDRPAGLGEALVAAGLAPAESEVAMTADLARLESPPAPEELRIARVRSLAEVKAFARLTAVNAGQPVVRLFYRIGAAALLGGGSPTRLYLGYLEGTPVATAELTMAGGVAGL